MVAHEGWPMPRKKKSYFLMQVPSNKIKLSWAPPTLQRNEVNKRNETPVCVISGLGRSENETTNQKKKSFRIIYRCLYPRLSLLVSKFHDSSDTITMNYKGTGLIVIKRHSLFHVLFIEHLLHAKHCAKDKGYERTYGDPSPLGDHGFQEKANSERANYSVI